MAGPYAVVGIDVDKDLDRSRVGSIKYAVLEALQKDPYGKTAVVVADGDVVERIRSMSDKAGQGYPVQGFVDELSAIVGRYMPDFPINEDRPKERDQNKSPYRKKIKSNWTMWKKNNPITRTKNNKGALPRNRWGVHLFVFTYSCIFSSFTVL